MEEQNKIPIEKPKKKKSIKKVDKKTTSFAYTPLHHMKYKLAQFEGKEQIPNEVLEQIKAKLKENNYPITRSSIMIILKELKLYLKYYDKIPSILNHLNQDNKVQKVTLDEPKECVVCLNEIKEFIQLSCKHLFCESCIDQIKKNNQIKCPLCRNMQDIIESYNLSEDDKNTILDEFSNSIDQYRTSGGKTFIPFELIIQDIADKKGIKINLV